MRKGAVESRLLTESCHPFAILGVFIANAHQPKLRKARVRGRVERRMARLTHGSLLHHTLLVGMSLPVAALLP